MSNKNSESRRNCDEFNLYEQHRDDDDIFKIHVSSNTNIPLIQLFKYSKLIQEDYLNNSNIIIDKIQQLNDTEKIKESSIDTFMKLLNDQNVRITVDQYCDLCKLSEIFKIKPLQVLLQKFSQNHSQNIDYIINLIMEQNSEINNDEFISIDKYSEEMESILSEKIEECLKNKNFEKVPISMIYRIIKKSNFKNISSDLLYNFISKSIKERCVLFSFIDVKNISDEILKQILDDSQNEEKKLYFQYIENDLHYIKYLRDKKEQLEERIKKLEKINQQLQEDNIQLKKINNEIRVQQKQVIEINEHIQKENKQLNKEINDIKIQQKQAIEMNQKLQFENKQLNKEINNNKIQQKQTIEMNQKLQSENQQLKKAINEICVQKKQSIKINQQLQTENKQLKKEINDIILKQKEIKLFTFVKISQFSGIVNHLSHQIKITSSSEERSSHSPLKVISHDDGDKYFKSKGEPNSWVCLNFTPYYVCPTDYTIGTTNNAFKLKSWVIEGSMDGSKFTIIDTKNNCNLTQVDDKVLHFNITNNELDIFKFIRLRITDRNWSNNYHIRLNSFEIYGKLCKIDLS